MRLAEGPTVPCRPTSRPTGGRLTSQWDRWDDYKLLRQDDCLAELTEGPHSSLWNNGAMRKQLDDHVCAFGSKRRVFSAAMDLLGSTPSI